VGREEKNNRKKEEDNKLFQERGELLSNSKKESGKS